MTNLNVAQRSHRAMVEDLIHQGMENAVKDSRDALRGGGEREKTCVPERSLR